MRKIEHIGMVGLSVAIYAKNRTHWAVLRQNGPIYAKNRTYWAWRSRIGQFYAKNRTHSVVGRRSARLRVVPFPEWGTRSDQGGIYRTDRKTWTHPRTLDPSPDLGLDPGSDPGSDPRPRPGVRGTLQPIRVFAYGWWAFCLPMQGKTLGASIRTAASRQMRSEKRRSAGTANR